MDDQTLGILCPNCASPLVRTLESRKVVAGVRRRRVCVKCEHRFTTREGLVICEQVNTQNWTTTK